MERETSQELVFAERLHPYTCCVIVVLNEWSVMDIITFLVRCSRNEIGYVIGWLLGTAVECRSLASKQPHPVLCSTCS